MKESTMDLKKWYIENLTRRQALKTMGVLTEAGFMLGTGTYNIHQMFVRKAGLAATPTISPTATGTGDATSIQHVLIACQENRSFDTYLVCTLKPEAMAFHPTICSPMAKVALSRRNMPPNQRRQTSVIPGPLFIANGTME